MSFSADPNFRAPVHWNTRAPVISHLVLTLPEISHIFHNFAIFLSQSKSIIVYDNKVIKGRQGGEENKIPSLLKLLPILGYGWAGYNRRIN
ncbi:hypothetical protein B9J78_03010 [bacterium Unc6]|nr:hypothetical protein [bacterium Unc6]